jgi:mRNA interferase RelE/StbE
MEQDEAGDYLIEVAKVWAVDYRKDSEVYADIRQRVANAGSSPKTKALSEVLALFTKQARDLTAIPEPDRTEPVPKWLTDALLYVVHLPASRVEEMSLEEAERTWADHISGTGTGV